MCFVVFLYFIFSVAILFCQTIKIHCFFFCVFCLCVLFIPAKTIGDIERKDLINSTRIRVARNISGFQLAPGQNDVKEKLAIEDLLKKVFNTLEGDLAGTYFPLQGMTEEVRQGFITDHLLFKGY